MTERVKASVLEMLQTPDHNISRTRVSGRIDSYKPKYVTHIWQVGGCEFPDLTVAKTQSVFFCSPLSVGDGKSHLNVIGVGSGDGENAHYETLSLLNLAYALCHTVNSGGRRRR